MKNSEKFKTLASNDAFLEKLISSSTDEEIRSAFKEEGFEISDEEIRELKEDFQKILSEEIKNMPEDALAEVSGGKVDLKLEAKRGAIEGGLGGAATGVIVGGATGFVTGIISAANKKPGESGEKLFFKKLFTYAAAGALAGTAIGSGATAGTYAASAYRESLGK